MTETLRSVKPKIFTIWSSWKKFVSPGLAENMVRIYDMGSFYPIFILEINMFPFPFTYIFKTEAPMVSISVFITIII